VKLTKTEVILVAGDAVMLSIAIGAFFFPQLVDLRKELWGLFTGWNGALMLALKTGPDQPPTLPND
jgi:hypothetical protein